MALFKSKRQRELEAEMQVRQSKAKIKRFIGTTGARSSNAIATWASRLCD